MANDATRALRHAVLSDAARRAGIQCAPHQLPKSVDSARMVAPARAAGQRSRVNRTNLQIKAACRKLSGTSSTCVDEQAHVCMCTATFRCSANVTWRKIRGSRHPGLEQGGGVSIAQRSGVRFRLSHCLDCCKSRKQSILLAPSCAGCSLTNLLARRRTWPLGSTTFMMRRRLHRRNASTLGRVGDPGLVTLVPLAPGYVKRARDPFRRW